MQSVVVLLLSNLQCVFQQLLELSLSTVVFVVFSHADLALHLVHCCAARRWLRMQIFWPLSLSSGRAFCADFGHYLWRADAFVTFFEGSASSLLFGRQ